ncbi:hypothetical protein ABZ723_34285 [Streptomyces sp. NPDC006700]|uniref:hypothetical protein n=1 Tax=Streptomyces sp. NPDC006700 TaxID=3154479 RepID=UPI0033F714CF
MNADLSKRLVPDELWELVAPLLPSFVESATELRVRVGASHIPDVFVQEHVAEGCSLRCAEAGD